MVLIDAPGIWMAVRCRDSVCENVGYCFILSPPKDRGRRSGIQVFSPEIPVCESNISSTFLYLKLPIAANESADIIDVRRVVRYNIGVIS